MPRIPKAEYEIRSSDNTQKGVKSAQGGLKKLSKGVATAGKAMAATFAATAAAVAALGVAIKKVTDIYAEQELAEIKLIAASRNNPLINGDAVSGLRDTASALQQVSIFGDEALIPLMSLGVNMGYTQEQIEGVAEAAVNLASATDMSLDSAFRNLYKTLGGTAGELGETIPMMRELTEEAMRNGEAVELINRQFGGMASAVASSTKGVKEQLKNMMGDVLEEIGSAFAPLSRMIYEKITPVLESIGEWFEKNSEQITNFFLHFGDIAKTTFTYVKSGLKEAFTWDGIVHSAQAFWTFMKNTFFNFINFAFSLIKAIATTIWEPLKAGFLYAIYGIQVGWTGMINGFKLALDWLIEKPINAIGKAFFHVINAIRVAWFGMTNGFKLALDWLIEKPINAIGKAFFHVINAIRVGWVAMTNSIKEAINWLIENPINSIAVAFKTVVNSVGEAIQWVLNGLIGLINGVLQGVDKIIEAAHNAKQFLSHPLREDRREQYTSIVSQLDNVEISWLDPQRHERLTTNLDNLVQDIDSVNSDRVWTDLTSNLGEMTRDLDRVNDERVWIDLVSNMDTLVADIQDIEKPNVDWSQSWDNIVSAWADAGQGAIDLFTGQIRNAATLYSDLAKPWAEGFDDYKIEFFSILNRELPPQAQSIADGLMQEVQSSVAAALARTSFDYDSMFGSGSSYSLWDLFTTYITDKFKEFGRNMAAWGRGVWENIKSFGESVSQGGLWIAKAFTEPKEAIAEAGFAFIRTMRRLGENSDKILAALGGALMWGVEKVGSALLSLGQWIWSMISGTEAMQEAMEILSDGISEIFESVVAPLIKAIQPLLNVIIQLVKVLMVGLKPILDVVVAGLKMLEPVIRALEPLIRSIIQVLDALAPIFLMLVDLVVQILYPVIEILTQAFSILADLLTKLAPVFEAVFGAIFNILAPILQFVADILQAIAPVLDFVADILLALAPIIEAVGILIGGILGPALEFVAELINAVLTPILVVLGQVLTVLTPLFEMISIILTALTPIFNVIFKLLTVLLTPLQILGSLLELLNPIFEILAGVLSILVPIFEFLALAIDAITRPIEFVADLLMFLGQGIKAAMQTIWYAITFQWGKLGDVEWPSFQSDAFTRPLGEYDTPTLQVEPIDTSTSDITSSFGTSTSEGRSSSSPSYGGQNLTVNVQILAEAVVGEPGLQEFAMMIENEIQRSRNLGLV